MSMRIYLDHNATTPALPEVMRAVRDALIRATGNPSSTHAAGRESRRWVDRSREQVAELLGAPPETIVFTGGGSESNNLAIKGRALACGEGHIITQVTEHPSVLEPVRYLESQGFRATYLRVDGRGQVDPADVERAIETDTILVSVQHANNETGTLQPVAEICRVARARGVPVHVDAAQSTGKIPVRVERLGATFLSVAGHKLHGPKGVGALFVAGAPGEGGIELVPLIHGAAHEGGRRAGTEAVHQMAGLAEACRVAAEDLESAGAAIRRRRDRLHDLLREEIDGLTLHGHPAERLPNTLNVGFPGVSGAELLEAARIEASTGSACHAGEARTSPVLEAMGIDAAAARGAVRLSLARTTLDEEVTDAAGRLVEAYRSLRR